MNMASGEKNWKIVPPQVLIFLSSISRWTKKTMNFLRMSPFLDEFPMNFPISGWSSSEFPHLWPNSVAGLNCTSIFSSYRCFSWIGEWNFHNPPIPPIPYSAPVSPGLSVSIQYIYPNEYPNDDPLCLFYMYIYIIIPIHPNTTKSSTITIGIIITIINIVLYFHYHYC